MELLVKSKNHVDIFGFDNQSIKTINTIPNVYLASYNADGSLYALMKENFVHVYSSDTNKQIFELPVDFSVEKISWSYNKKYLLLASRLTVSRTNNFCIINLQNQKIELTNKYSFISNLDDAVSISNEDLLMLVTNAGIYTYDLTQISIEAKFIAYPSINRFVLAPNVFSQQLYAFIKMSNSKVAGIYSIDIEINQLKIVLPIDIAGINEIEAKWSPKTNYLAVILYKENQNCRSYFDTSVINIYSMQELTSTTSKNAFNPVYSNDGPVHYFSWLNFHKAFIGSGEMPCNMVLLDLHNQKNSLFFGKNRRNFVIENNDVCVIAGLKNLPGDYDVWDLQTNKLLITDRFKCATTVKLSPCSQYIISATTHPRMTYDNMFYIHKINGKELVCQKYDYLEFVLIKPELAKRVDLDSVDFTSETTVKQKKPIRSLAALIEANETYISQDCKILKEAQPYIQTTVDNKNKNKKTEVKQVKNYPVGIDPALIAKNKK